LVAAYERRDYPDAGDLTKVAMHLQRTSQGSDLQLVFNNIMKRYWDIATVYDSRSFLAKLLIMIGNPQHRQAANDAIPAQFDSEPMMFSVESLGDFVDVRITILPPLQPSERYYKTSSHGKERKTKEEERRRVIRLEERTAIKLKNHILEKEKHQGLERLANVRMVEMEEKDRELQEEARLIREKEAIKKMLRKRAEKV